MIFGEGSIDWVTIGIVLAVLVIGWTLLKAALRLTMRVFTIGCLGLLVVGAVLAALGWFSP
jgi:hypothetical protein